MFPSASMSFIFSPLPQQIVSACSNFSFISGHNRWNYCCSSISLLFLLCTFTQSSVSVAHVAILIYCGSTSPWRDSFRCKVNIWSYLMLRILTAAYHECRIWNWSWPSWKGLSSQSLKRPSLPRRSRSCSWRSSWSRKSSMCPWSDEVIVNFNVCKVSWSSLKSAL